MPKRDSASKRLHDLIELRSWNDGSLWATLMGVSAEPSPGDDPKKWHGMALLALKIDSDPTSGSILNRAFEALKLDPTNPLDWRLLCYYLANLHFSDPPKGGRPRQWNQDRYCQLLEEVDRRANANRSMSDTEICRRIAANRSSPFRRAGADELRKMLRNARSYENNPAVRILVDEIMPEMRKISQERGLPLEEPAMKKVATKYAVDWISSRWQRRGDKTVT